MLAATAGASRKAQIADLFEGAGDLGRGELVIGGCPSGGGSGTYIPCLFPGRNGVRSSRPPPLFYTYVSPFISSGTYAD